MHKIVAISMVKNEADILESFVRHTLTFADMMLIVDHDSCDATGEILSSLQAEGLPIIVQPIHTVEYSQAEITTALMWQAIREYKADLIFPLDADEFLLPQEPGTSCRELLQTLDLNKVYAFPWIRYELLQPEQEQNMFLLKRNSRREKNAQRLKKIIIGRQVAETFSLTIVQGNHAAVVHTEHGAQELSAACVSGMHLGHFQWRSREQMISKVTVGWLNNVTRYSIRTSRAFHWKTAFHSLLQQGHVSVEPMSPEAENVDFGTGLTSVDLQYTSVVPHAALRNLMTASEKIAEAYIEEKVLRQQKIVSIILPFMGDCAAFEQSFANALEQTYPYKEILICNATGAGNRDVEAMVDAYKGEVTVKYLLPSEETRNVFALLDQEAAGTYVQWLFPGDILDENKILHMVVPLETQKDFSFILCNAVRFVASEADKSDDEFNFYMDINIDGDELLLAKVQNLWEWILHTGDLPSGNLGGALFRRDTMQRCAWLQDCFNNGQPLFLSMWGHILQDGIIGGIGEDNMMARRTTQQSIGNLFWHELEWFFLLDEYKKTGNISAVQYQKSIRVIWEHRETLRQMKMQVDAGLYQQYEYILHKILNVVHNGV
jgi:hypothetical protein